MKWQEEIIIQVSKHILNQGARRSNHFNWADETKPLLTNKERKGRILSNDRLRFRVAQLRTRFPVFMHNYFRLSFYQRAFHKQLK